MPATNTTIPALDGGTVTVKARTLCLHGDGPTAVKAARAVRATLEHAGVVITAYR